MQLVFRVEVILDGRVYRWFVRDRDEAVRLMSRVSELFPKVTLGNVEPVQRLREGPVTVVQI